MRYTWEEYQQFIDNKTLKLEESMSDLHLYHYFDTLQWSWRYAVVLNNEILFNCEDYPIDYWNGAETVYKMMSR
jgi:hypothetical protein